MSCHFYLAQFRVAVIVTHSSTELWKRMLFSGFYSDSSYSFLLLKIKKIHRMPHVKYTFSLFFLLMEIKSQSLSMLDRQSTMKL